MISKTSLSGVLIAGLLCACSPTGDSEERHRVEPGDGVVRVLDAGDEAHARPFAQEYCAAYGATAEFKRLLPHRHGRYASASDVEFVCVVKPVPDGRRE